MKATHAVAISKPQSRVKGRESKTEKEERDGGEWIGLRMFIEMQHGISDSLEMLGAHALNL